MASLDKLASMDGWDVGEDVTDGSVSSVTRPQCILKDAVGGAGPAIGASAAPRGSEGGGSSLHNNRNKESKRPRNSEQVLEQVDRAESQAGSRSHSDPPTHSVQTPTSSVRSSEHVAMEQQLDRVEVQAVGSQRGPAQSVTPLKNNGSNSSSVSLASGMASHTPDEILTNPGDEAGVNKGEHKHTPVPDELLPCKHASGNNDDRAAATVKKLDPQTGATATPQGGLSSSPNQSHLIGTPRKGGFVGSDASSGSNRIAWGSCSGGGGGGGDYGGDVTLDGGTSEAVIAKLKASLRKEQEERARQEKRREVFEEQARAAHVSLEATSKRAEELENRVRMLTMASSISGNGGGSSVGVAGLSCQSSNRSRRARSMSPVGQRRTTSRARGYVVNAETAERQAQMAVIADATETARGEAQSALDVVEGFATLNRKLVDELRTAVSVRDDLLESLSTERGFRHQLEGEVEELLAGGMALAVAEKEHELEVRYGQQHEDTKRAAALHSRMEDEYRCALKSSSQERARLESWAERLEGELLDERHSHALRVKEEAERAAMGAEEVGSIRAGLAPRTKRLGHDQSNSRLPSRNNARGGGRRQSGGGWRGAKPGRRIETQQRNRGDQKKGLLATLNSKGPFHGSPAEAAVAAAAVAAAAAAAAAGGSGVLNSKGIERRNTSRDGGGGTLDKAGASASSAANVGGGPRSTIFQPANKAGDPFVGLIGSAGKGDESLGCEVYAAAAESVELFLGDFVPAMLPPPSSAVTAGTQEKGGGPAASSRWKAIGQGGRLSARALAMCAKEADTTAKVEAHARLCSLINGSAHVLSSSWFFLLNREAKPLTNSSRGGAGGSGGGVAGDALPPRGVSRDGTATVSIVVVRRLVQTCGIVRSSEGGPTPAHADAQLRRNAVGKGRLGYREYFKTIMSLVNCRFAGQSKDSALEQLSILLQPTLTGNATVGTAAAANSVESVESWLEGTNLEDMLAGAERVLKRDRRALEAIFSHYATVCSPEAGASSPRGKQVLPLAALTSLCKDFELTPSILPRANAHRIYAQLVYPNESLLTPESIAAKEGLSRGGGGGGGGGRNGRAILNDGCRADVGGLVAPAGLGLGQWLAWLGLVGIGCTWFDKQRGLYNTPTEKVLGLLQWMECSGGKARISSTRGAAVVPAFNLLPLQGTPHARR